MIQPKKDEDLEEKVSATPGYDGAIEKPKPGIKPEGLPITSQETVKVGDYLLIWGGGNNLYKITKTTDKLIIAGRAISKYSGAVVLKEDGTYLIGENVRIREI